MKIVTKNIKLEKGVRHYLIYLNDYNGNPLECLEAEGDEERIKKENELSKKHNISTKDLDYVSLEKFRAQTREYTPLILVFYLERNLFTNREMVAASIVTGKHRMRS